MERWRGSAVGAIPVGLAGRGRRLWARLAGLPRPGAGEIGRLRDECARLRQEVGHLRATAERNARLVALGTMTAGLAHEIRNPLVSVRTFFQLAPQRWHDEEFAGEFRELTAREVERIKDLVDDMLGLVRAPGNDREHVEPEELVDRTVRLLAPRARHREIRLVCEVDEHPPAIRAASGRLKQVLVNLVLNAIDATPAGGAVTVRTGAVADGGRELCRIEVQDTGPGIPAELQKRIFEPFFTTREEGTGLGLSMARDIVCAHGGRLSVHSDPGSGSCFRVDLPIDEAAARPAVRPTGE